MKYRRLGDAGVKVSEISLGGWLTFGNALARDDGREVIDAAFDNGINFFDTANIYAQGACEELWGELLQRYTRSDYVLATKVFGPMGDGPNDKGCSRKHITEQIHASLRRLRTDYVDLYQCHRFDDETPLEETMSTMDDLVRQGKILYWGFSEWPAERIREAMLLYQGRGLERPRSSQPQYSIIWRDIEEEVLPVCDREGIGQIVWSPLGQGVLTGKYRPGQEPPPGSRAADEKQNQFIKERVHDKDLLERILKLEPIAKEAGLTMAQLALAWCLRHKGMSSCIIGATRAEQVVENCGASGRTLPPEVLDKIDELFPPKAAK